MDLGWVGKGGEPFSQGFQKFGQKPRFLDINRDMGVFVLGRGGRLALLIRGGGGDSVGQSGGGWAVMGGEGPN